jgi:hypothetical protein
MAVAIDFRDLLQSAAVGYLPRPQIELAVRQKLQSASAGMIVMRGEPGAGKTCLVAAQIQAHGGLCHFLRRGHTEYSLWRDPYGFLTSIGFQLRERFGEWLFPASVAIDTDQRVHMLEEGASLTGIHIQRLVSVPWREANLHVRQDVGEAKGQVIGLQVEEMVEEYHRIPLNIFREMALVAPLRRLKTKRPDERLVLWVDALDEEPAGEQTIAGVLPSAEELQSLGNLWVVVASRPGQYLERFLNSGAELVDFADVSFAEDNRALMQAYVRRALTDSEVQAAISAAGKEDLNLAESVLAQAGDNPLYLDQFFRSVRSGGLQALLQGGLPSGLDAIQARLLGALAANYGTTFTSQMFPVLQVFAAARRPLSRVQLTRFSGLADEQVGATLRVLQPYLEVFGQEPAATYALYHRSFQETLIAPKHQAQSWYVSSPAANDRMSDAYWKDSSVNIEDLDEYGLDFLSMHLASGGKQARQRLLALPSRTWRRVRRQAAGSNWPFIEDLRRVLQEAQSLPIEEAIPTAARVALVAGMIQDAERELPSGALKATVRLGMLQRALGAVSPEMELGQQVARLAEIASALVALSTSMVGGSEPARFPDIYYQVLRQALDLLKRKPSGFDLARMLEVQPLDTSTTMQDILNQAAEIARLLPPNWQRPRALIEVARLYTAVDPGTAKSWFHTAMKDCPEQLRSSLTMEQERLVRYWSAFDPQAVAEVLPRLRLSPDVYSVRAVLNLGRRLNASGASGALADLTAQAEGNLLAAVKDPYERVMCEVELAHARHELGELATAQAALERVRQSAAQIGTEQDPERGQQRPRQGVDALIAIAGLAVKLAHSEAQDLLEGAWNAYAQHGSFNIRPTELVKLQVQLEPGLLEVYLDQITDFERQASTWLAAVDALLDSSMPVQQKLARRWLDQALESAERALPNAWGGPFIYAAALATPPQNRETALQWVRSKLQAEEEVAFRLNVLHRLPIDDPQGPAWLAATLQVWMESSSNENYYADLPTALLHLPVELTGSLLANPPEIGDSLKRCYLILALSALAERRSPNSGRALFEQALKLISQAASDRTPAAMLQAYAAGMWWTLDPLRAHSLWTEALAWLNVGEAFERDLNQRHHWLMRLSRQLEAGAPQAALQVYLSFPEPPMPAGSYSIIVPGALVDPVIQAGLSERDYCLGLAAARSLASENTSPLRESIANLFPPAVRALALAHAAITGSTANRLRQVEAAMEAALQVEPPHLRWLLYARGVSALSEMGAHQRALERLPRAAQTILQALPVFGTVPMSAYGHALGLLTASLVAADEVGEASALLFGARGLGGNGVYRTLAEVCKPFVAQAKREGLGKLLDQIEEAEKVMTT